LSVTIKGRNDCTLVEVENILIWANNNRMTINLTKTKEILGDRSKDLYLLLHLIFTRETYLKILGAILIVALPRWVRKRMCILRVCKI